MIRAIRPCLVTMILTAATTGIAQAEIVQINCGVPVDSRVVTSDDLFQTPSKTFERIRGAIVTVRVPDGQKRCVKVRFTGSAICSSPFGNAACFIRAKAKDATLRPEAGSRQSFSGGGPNPTAPGYQWVGRLGPGEHIIQIQVRTDVGAGIKVGVEDWTMDVETLNVAP